MLRNAEQPVEDVTERRHTVEIVKDDDGGHRPECDVIGDVRGEVVEVLTQFTARLTVHLEY